MRQDWQPDRDWVRKMADNLGDEWKVRVVVGLLSCGICALQAVCPSKY